MFNISSFFVGASVTDYFFQSNFAGQVIVVILLVFSVVAWAVMFCKNADLSTMDKLNDATMKKVSKSSTLIEAAADKSLKGPFAILLKEAVSAWGKVGIGNETAESRSMRVSYVENVMLRALSKQIIKYESKMTPLGTIISGAPFLGLLGTAWGVMDCFGSMSGQTSVTLQQLAPGVAGALLTTVAGLVVAIPALFGYNYLSTKARNMTTDLENFASMLADKIDIESRETEAPRHPEKIKPVIRETVVSTPSEPRVINFTLDDDDNSPVPPRDFNE